VSKLKANKSNLTHNYLFLKHLKEKEKATRIEDLSKELDYQGDLKQLRTTEKLSILERSGHQNEQENQKFSNQQIIKTNSNNNQYLDTQNENGTQNNDSQTEKNNKKNIKQEQNDSEFQISILNKIKKKIKNKKRSKYTNYLNHFHKDALKGMNDSSTDHNQYFQDLENVKNPVYINQQLNYNILNNSEIVHTSENTSKSEIYVKN
jgi:hypothetical protein